MIITISLLLYVNKSLLMLATDRGIKVLLNCKDWP